MQRGNSFKGAHDSRESYEMRKDRDRYDRRTRTRDIPKRSIACCTYLLPSLPYLFPSQVAKICNNMLLAIGMIGTAEAMALGKKYVAGYNFYWFFVFLVFSLFSCFTCYFLFSLFSCLVYVFSFRGFRVLASWRHSFIVFTMRRTTQRENVYRQCLRCAFLEVVKTLDFSHNRYISYKRL